MCSNRDRRERSTRAENRQPSAALAEITRRRAVQQARQHSADAVAGQLNVSAIESGRCPRANGRSSESSDSGAAPDSRSGPAYVDLTASSQDEDDGERLSAPTEHSSGSAALPAGSSHLTLRPPEDEPADGVANSATAWSAQPQQPRKLNRLRRAGSPVKSDSTASSSQGAAGRQLANAAGAGLGGLLASFGALQVMTRTHCWCKKSSQTMSKSTST